MARDMTKKRAYNAERQYQRPPTSKQNRQHQPAQAHPQAQQSQPQLQPNHYHQAPQKPTFDPTKCAQQFERLSLSQSNYPPLNALKHSGGIPCGTQQNTTIVDNSRHLQPNQPWANATPTTEVVNQNTQFQVGRPTNLYSAALQTNPIRQAFPGKSYQFQSGWTEVVKQGIYHQNNNNHQASSVRNPWNNSNQAPINPSSKITKPFTCHPSRPIVNLPQLHHNNLSIRCPKLQPQQAKSTLSKRPNLPLVMPGDVAKIDIVLDTNILLAYQHFLRALIPFLGSSCRLLIPTAVISELDVQKNRPYLIDVFEAGRFVSQQPMSQLARQASKWLLACRITPFQFSPPEAHRRIRTTTKAQGRGYQILTYAHQIYHQAKSQEVNTIIALLSNDTLLRLRAQSEGICSLAMSDFRHSPRQLESYIRKTVSLRSNQAVPGPSNPLMAPRLLPWAAPSLQPPLLAPATTSAPHGQFTFTSLLPSISQPSDSSTATGPDQQLIRLKSQIQRARSCTSCKTSMESIPQVSPDQIHHYCPMCCEIICKGCMNVTGCDWNCPGPYHGRDCQTIKCCAIGRASIWIKGNLILASYEINTRYRCNMGPKSLILYGDEALVQYMKAAHSLLLVSGDQDERLGFLESILISSTLIDVLSQTLLGSPLLSWHFRSELFLSAINVYELVSLLQITDSTTSFGGRLSKRLIDRILTDEKVRELEASFPKLMADVKEILHNRPGSCSATIRELSDNTVYVPICFVLEHLFRLAIEMETRPSNHSVTLPGDIQVRVPLSSDLVRMTSALLDLQIIYESRVSLTQENNTTLHSSNSATSQRNGKHRYNKKTFKNSRAVSPKFERGGHNLLGKGFDSLNRKQENAQQSDSKLSKQMSWEPEARVAFRAKHWPTVRTGAWDSLKPNLQSQCVLINTAYCYFVLGADLPSHRNEWLLLSLVLVAHLHVVSGLSRADSNITLVTLKSILHSFDKQRNTQTLASGLLVKVALIAAVCDLPAIHKLIGYASHSAEMFCSFCYLPQSRNQDLDHAAWSMRTIEGHKAESEAWKSATTHTEREELFKVYWDPTKFTVVEAMHLLSGMLCWHAIKVWCLKEIALELKDKKPVQYDIPVNEDHFDEDHYKQLREDERYYATTNDSGINLRSLQDALMEIDQDIQANDDSSEDPCVFSSKDLSKIRWVIKQTQIPLWLNRPSPIFGDASAGKVRSADWISFFTIFMPFAIMELKRTNQNKLVESWYHLAMLTEIAMDCTTDQNKIHQYLFHLTSSELYHDLNPTPNEHMAYHLPKQLQTFGPANFLASWHFEQINGILQKCPTNNKIAELDYTLLKHAGRASNLGVLLESAQLPPLLARIAPLLSQKKKLRSPIGDLNEEHQELLKFDKKFLSNYKTNLKIPPYIYSRAIKLLQTREPSNSRTKYISEYKQRGNFSQHEVPVPTLDKSTRHHKHSGLTYTDSSDKGSSSIKYSLSLNERQSCFGKIQQIFQILLRNFKHHFDNGKKRIDSGTISVSSASVTKISQEIHELSISSPDSGSSNGSSDIGVLN
ncbi:hypothetical protein PSHT_08759 [Puccinia striiformis]|uniref:PIN domain-containing protein n=1 Tax=Puccinia striiformis TaxID=27350 RepID=A0A2S4VLS6_9BASI|nr:hypothetical protein PSHT_08759 [Puccinia striiformis]